MKGIILAGGSGTRLYPMTQIISKQLQPIYDKPMIYYPLSTLMLAGIREILIISTPFDTPKFKDFLGDGTKWGIHLDYEIQEKPGGIAQAFLIGEKFIGKDSVVLMLGDNLFYGLFDFLRAAISVHTSATIFGYYVNKPEDYGVVQFGEDGKVVSIEEKPQKPNSNYAVPGLYIYDNTVIDITKNLQPSDRGELEITDVNVEYLKRSQLHVQIIGRGVAWLDTGTPENLLEASHFIATIEKRQGLRFGCIEEVALRMKYINHSQFLNTIESIPKCDYKTYLESLVLEEGKRG